MVQENPFETINRELAQETARATPLTFYETLREITQDQREVGYNHPLINFLRTAIRWSLRPKYRQAKVVVTPLDVAWQMVDFKQARLDNGYHTDSTIDTAGYASCAARMDEKLKELGYADGVKIFDSITIGGMIELLTELERNGLTKGGS